MNTTIPPVRSRRHLSRVTNTKIPPFRSRRGGDVSHGAVRGVWSIWSRARGAGARARTTRAGAVRPGLVRRRATRDGSTPRMERPSPSPFVREERPRVPPRAPRETAGRRSSGRRRGRLRRGSVAIGIAIANATGIGSSRRARESSASRTFARGPHRAHPGRNENDPRDRDGCRGKMRSGKMTATKRGGRRPTTTGRRRRRAMRTTTRGRGGDGGGGGSEGCGCRRGFARVRGWCTRGGGSGSRPVEGVEASGRGGRGARKSASWTRARRRGAVRR